MTSSKTDLQLHQLEERLALFQEKEEVTNLFHDRLQVGLIVLKNRHIFSVNNKITSLLGYSGTDIESLPFMKLVPDKQSNGLHSVEIFEDAYITSLSNTVELNDWRFISSKQKIVECDILFTTIRINHDMFSQLEVY